MRATDRDPSEAYNDNPHPIGHRATISAPHMHAYCLDLLESRLTPGSTALDVGCGSGYLSACMSRMMGSEGKVIGIDYIPQLVRMSEENVRKDDPSLLDQQQIIFKSIHVGAAASMVPEELLKQLKPGGLMVIPVGDQEQILMKYTKDNNGSIEKSTLMGVRYVPLIKIEAWRAKASYIHPGRMLKESEYDASVEHTTYCINVARYELPLSLCSRENLDRRCHPTPKTRPRPSSEAQDAVCLRETGYWSSSSNSFSQFLGRAYYEPVCEPDRPILMSMSHSEAADEAIASILKLMNILSQVPTEPRDTLSTNKYNHIASYVHPPRW
ncbi:protein-L-isoaspartate methyltransferase 2 [Planoprotostelium fungivorum]|uniref:protein-L-isoaspartate(D-aspartate) O-methyltransferase n=1 Tax=Planoprotostelium fungivorum TaxID=1890364 RepID=A0A2P6MT44_9EUKA|nr:protein-L-isoaspartate methyltransferase 2 [Planoprotostelium fungivorum]